MSALVHAAAGDGFTAPASQALQAPPARPRVRSLTAEATFIGRSIRHSVRDVEALLMAVVLPVMLMLMFTWIFGNAIDPSGGYVDYVVPGIILLCAGFGAASTAVSVSRDMTRGSSTASARCRSAAAPS